MRKKQKISNKARCESGDLTVDTTEIYRIMRQYEQTYANKFYNPEEMNTFLETHNLPD